MCRQTIRLTAAFVVCLASPVGLPASEQAPQADGEPSARSLETRLAELESQVRLIQRHLGLQMKPPDTTGVGESRTDASNSEDRLGRVESEIRRVGDRLERIQHELENTRLARHPVTPEASPNQGRLVIRNWTGVTQCVSVNRFQHYVQPGRTDIWVPRQAVEAYLPAYERPKLLGMTLWRWTGQDYEMPLEIRN